MLKSKSLSASSILDTTQANFPMLAHAFIPSGFDEAAQEWTDEITGQVMSTSDATENGGNYINFASVSAHTMPAPTVPPLTKDVVLLVLGKFGSSATFIVGDTTEVQECISVRANGISYVVSDNDVDYSETISLVGVAGATGEVSAMGLSVDWDGDSGTVGVDSDGAVYSFKITNAGIATLNAAGVATGNGCAIGISAFTVNTLTYTSAAADEIWGMYVLHATRGQLPDLMAGIEWMRSNPTKGMYPGWKGMS